MPYAENSQLPEAVKNSLSEADQTKWRTVFNSALGGACSGDDTCAAKVAWSEMKKQARYFNGWASVELVDRQGDVVEIGAFKKTLDFFMATGASMMDQHSNRRVGSWINYELKTKMCSDGQERPGVFLEGIVFKGQRIYDDVWEKICRKEYSDLSIGADPLEQGKQCTAKTCWNAVKSMDLFEVSPVEVGANQEASIEEVNVLAKSHIHIGDTMAEEPKPTIEKAADTGDGAPAVEQTIAKSDEILTLLKGMEGRLTELEKKLQKEESKPEDEEEMPEDEEKEKSAVPVEEITGAVEKALEKSLEEKLDEVLTKRLDAKEPATPRPDKLTKNDHLEKSIEQQMMEDASAVAGMGYKQISQKLDKEEARPW